MSMESTFIHQISLACHKKEALFDSSKLRYGIRSIFAGAFLTLSTAGGAYAAEKIAQTNPNLEKFAFSFLFAWGLVYILFLHAELTTSNMMYLSAGVYLKKIAPVKALKILLYCTVCNLLGAVFIALLFAPTTAFSHIQANSFLVGLVENKISRSSGLIVIEGIIANIFVNIAILSYLLMKDTTAKIMVVVSAIFLFVFLGNDHVAANFASFSLLKFSQGSQFIADFSVLNILRQWTMAFIGNYIGGGVLIGLTYAFLNRDQEDYVD